MGKQQQGVSVGYSRAGEHVTMDFWHGILPNEDAATMLQTDGEFLLRGCEKDNVIRIVLSVRCKKNLLNAFVTEGPKGYTILGNHFDSLKDLVDFYQVRKSPLKIEDQKAVLETPIRRKSWELRHQMIHLGDELGSGAYGTVFKGTLKFERQKPINVAVKVLSEINAETSSALWKEARNQHQFDHPNIVKMYGVANDYLPFYLVMELVPGGSVDKYLEKKGSRLSIRERIQILIEAAQGLEYLHSKECLHRDIACRNLLIDKVVKVADFGMSRKAKRYKIDPNKPMNLRWLAPEVYETAIVNAQTDIYAFGVTIYECFTVPYTIPYGDWKPEKVYDKVVNKGYRLEAPKIMPRIVADVMDECLGPEAQRPSFKAILACLKASLKEKATKGLGFN